MMIGLKCPIKQKFIGFIDLTFMIYCDNICLYCRKCGRDHTFFITDEGLKIITD